MLWGSIQMNTLLDSSEQHIAEMMINGTTMGIIDMTKKLNELEKPKANEKKIAEEFIESSQAYIDMWKTYLYVLLCPSSLDFIANLYYNNKN